jgi:tRNA(Ile)-lysidine synthase
LPTAGGSVILAASGGADSTALLLAMDELIRAGKLSTSLTVAHLDHALRDSSRDDAAWVVALAEQFGYPAVKRRVDVLKRASQTGDNLEQAARRARYSFLETTAKKHHAQLILTAHTLDDQAETVLLRLLRGSAAEGLGGIEAVRAIGPQSKIQLARPLISWARRSDAEGYCRERGVEFRSDEMNEDEKFSRVRVRKQLLPLMQSFNSKIVEALGRTATLLREDAGALTAEAAKLVAAASIARENSAETNLGLLSVIIMAKAPAAVRRRALRLWLERERGHLRRVEMVHLVAIDQLLTGNRGGRVAELPDGGIVSRKGGWLKLTLQPNGKKS